MMLTFRLFTTVLIVINLAGIKFTQGFKRCFEKSSFNYGIAKARKSTVLASSTIRSDEYGYIPLSPSNIKTLRKEVSKRRASKRLIQDWLPEEETSGPFSEETLEKISNLLKENELVEIRGISKDDKKYIRSTSEELSYELSQTSGQIIELVQTKGFSSIFYCPGDSITLRTSYKPFQWEKRPKPLRTIFGTPVKASEKRMYELPKEEKKGPFSEKTLTSIKQLLGETDLVVVHGVSKDDKKEVDMVAEKLEFQLSQVIGRNVRHVQTRGFSCTFYSYTGKTPLRSMYLR